MPLDYVRYLSWLIKLTVRRLCTVLALSHPPSSQALQSVTPPPLVSVSIPSHLVFIYPRSTTRPIASNPLDRLPRCTLFIPPAALHSLLLGPVAKSLRVLFSPTRPLGRP